MKDLLLFVAAICAGLFLIVGYFTFIGKSGVINVPSLRTIFRASNFSLEKAPSESLIGKIASMSGDVQWQSRIATDSARLESPINIQQGENLSTKEKSSAVILFDGNLEVELSEKSEVGFAQTLPANIVIAQGSGTVEYKKVGVIPVSIRILHLLIENEGDVKVSLDDQQPLVTLEIVTGSVKLSFNDINNVTSVTVLSAGKKLIFNDDTRQVVTK